MMVNDRLNPNQQKAATDSTSTIIIIAGPGTGKTRTLISRLNYLINVKATVPSKILVITFTRKAVEEIRNRLKSKLLKQKYQPTITTFHALAKQIIEKVEPSITIIDDQQKKMIINDIITTHQLANINLSEFEKWLQQKKNNPNLKIQQTIERCLQEYQLKKQTLGLKDFDDLIDDALALLNRYPKLREELQQKYQHILIDEFQDTNRQQYQLLCLIRHQDTYLFAIGDPAQSIYSFRGATADVFRNLQTDFPNHQVITLTNNYRSTSNILTCAERIFPRIKLQATLNQQEGVIKIVSAEDEYSEARYIISDINKEIGGIDLLRAQDMSDCHGTVRSFADFAILYRKRSAVKIFTDYFFNSGIPFQVIGDDSPYCQPATAFIIALLRYSYLKDSQSLEKLLLSPFFGLSNIAISSLIHSPLITDLSKTKTNHKLNSKDQQIIKKLIDWINLYSSLQAKLPLSELLAKTINYWEVDRRLSTVSRQLQSLKQLRVSLSQFDRQGINDCLNYLSSLEKNNFYDQKTDKVSLLTIHSAKGLEFSCVYICGFNEGVIPSTKGELEEEKRLLYVAVTRAKRKLVFTFPQKRKGKPQLPSSFIKIIDQPTIIKEKATPPLTNNQKKWRERRRQLTLFS